MPRSAPNLNLGTPDRWKVSVRFIDATGDLRSESQLYTTLPTDANIDAMVDALGAQSNADIYEVAVEHVYASVGDSSNATNATRASVSQNLVFLAKNPAGDSRNLFVPAPVEACFITSTDEIDPANALTIATLAAWVNMLPAGFGIVSGRFTGRREKNKAVKI
jgi:hypothetical protein